MVGQTYTPFNVMSQPDYGMAGLGGSNFQPNAQVQGMPDFSNFGMPGGSQDWFGIKGLGMNMPTAQLGLDGLKSIGGLYASMGALGVAKKQLALSSMIANKNIQNQTMSYNTALSDKARSRGVAEGQSQQTVDDYIKKNSLSGT